MLIAASLLPISAAHAQERIVLFDEADGTTAGYYEASDGVADDPDFLELALDRYLPLQSDHAFSGEIGGLLHYRHLGGLWSMSIGRHDGEVTDLSDFDSLIVHLNGPAPISGGELPRIGLQDESGGATRSIWMSSSRNVQIDPGRTGFSPESATDAQIVVAYTDTWPEERRRPGYPEDLTVTFADVPLDTSTAGIGAPAVPAHFRIVTDSGIQPEFRFRDTNQDGTLSAVGEYIEVMLPEEEGSTDDVVTWRLSLSATPVLPPSQGDVFHLGLTFDAFALDADPETWQRLSLPLDDLTADGDFSPSQFRNIVFEHGGPNEQVRTLWIDRLEVRQNDDDAFLEALQEITFGYFWHEANSKNGLVKDRSTPGSPASIAAVGFGLSALTVGIDHGWITREEGLERVLTTLEFFWNAPQDSSADATGYMGFFYHFLNMKTGKRVWNSELSTIDTALLLAGVLHVREYFDGEGTDEAAIRALSDSIYYRVDWSWMQFRDTDAPSAAISHGWRPGSGFIQNDWKGYNEAMILYILALGSPTHPVESDAWKAWVSGYGDNWGTEYGYTFLTFPPLFGHQYSHVWIDFRGIQDAYLQGRGIDYFENSRRATLAQRAYHIANPKGWPNYGKDEWGLTASDTPTGYRARGAPPAQNDDGTLAPTAPGGSIAFTPDESIAALRTMKSKYPELWGPYGFRDAYNIARSPDWFDSDYIGIDQGPILLMIENHRTEAIWERMMQHEAIRRGLERAGFTGVGLASEPEKPGEAFELAVYPNPTTGPLQIGFSIELPGRVMLSGYDLLGRRVAMFETAYRATGIHHVEADLSHLSSGVYFIMLEAPDGTTIQPISLIR